MSKKRSVSEGYLDGLFSKAVRIKAHGICAKCGGQGSQAHHIIKRRFKVLRWDVNNGVWLCPACHQWVHNDIRGLTWQVEHANMDYLAEHQENLKDYLMREGITNDEFRLRCKRNLKTIVDGYRFSLP